MIGVTDSRRRWCVLLVTSHTNATQGDGSMWNRCRTHNINRSYNSTTCCAFGVEQNADPDTHLRQKHYCNTQARVTDGGTTLSHAECSPQLLLLTWSICKSHEKALKSGRQGCTICSRQSVQCNQSTTRGVRITIKLQAFYFNCYCNNYRDPGIFAQVFLPRKCSIQKVANKARERSTGTGDSFKQKRLFVDLAAFHHETLSTASVRFSHTVSKLRSIQFNSMVKVAVEVGIKLELPRQLRTNSLGLPSADNPC